MSDKYLYQTPYLYCGNNPVKIIDPNGEDEWEFNDKGYMENVKPSDYDSFHKVDSRGNRTGESMSFDSKIIDGDIQTYGSTKLEDAQMVSINNPDAGDQLFEYLSKNTSVEWGLVNTESEHCMTFLGTNGDPEANSIRSIVSGLGYNIERMVHNHPNDINSVSEGDHNGAVGNQTTQFYNWTRSQGYTRFDESSPYVTKSGNFKSLLKEIRVTPQ